MICPLGALQRGANAKTFVGSSLIYGLGHVQDYVCVVFASRFVQSLQEHPLKKGH